MTARWQASLAYALVGEEFDLPPTGSPDPDAIVRQLQAEGWPADRIADHARRRIAEELVWPHPLPERLKAGVGAAQFLAALGRARDMLGVVVLETRPPSGRSQLNPDEERLLREVPPHHLQ